MGIGAADGTGIRLHGTKREAATGKNPMIRLFHLLITDGSALIIGIKGIGVFHDKFPPAHQAESGPYLVPELGLNLVEVGRQLPIGLQFPAGDIGNYLFMGRAKAVVAPVPILETKEFGPIFLPAPGFLPEISRLDHGHEQLLGAGPVHLFADYGGNPLQGHQAQGKIGIESGGQLPDITGAEKKLMADNFGLGRGFLYCRYQ